MMERIAREAGHPDDLLQAAYIDGSLEGAALESLESHLASCDACRAGIALLRLDDGKDRGAVPRNLVARALDGGASRPGSARRAAWVLSAAAAMMILASVALFRLATAPAVPGPAVYRSGDIVSLTGIAPAFGARVPRDGMVFDWTQVPGAESYEIVLLARSGEVVAEFAAPPGSPPAAWPEEKKPPAAGTYLWKVKALSLGRVLSESPPLPFEVIP